MVVVKGDPVRKHERGGSSCDGEFEEPEGVL